jgi:predicted HAD superfamily hydrolase
MISVLGKAIKKSINKCESAAKDAYFDVIDKVFQDLKIDDDYGSRFSWYKTFLNTFKNKTDEQS